MTALEMLHGALRRRTSIITAHVTGRSGAGTPQEPYLTVTYRQLGPWRIGWRPAAGGFVWLSGPRSTTAPLIGNTDTLDQVTRDIAALLRAPIPRPSNTER